MERARKVILKLFVIIFICINYAHGLLPQLHSAKPEPSYSKYLDAGTEELGNSLVTLIYLNLIYPGAFLGRLVHGIMYDSGDRPWPRINTTERKIMVTLLTPNSRVFLYKKHHLTFRKKVFNDN